MLCPVGWKSVRAMELHRAGNIFTEPDGKTEQGQLNTGTPVSD